MKNVEMNSCDISSEIIGTRGLATCYGILFYDRENKIAIVGHTTNYWYDVLIKMLDLIRNTKTIEYYIFPGYDRIINNDLKVKDDIIHFLNQFNKLNKIKFIYNEYEATLDEETKSYEFFFDPKSASFIRLDSFDKHI